MSQPQSLKAEAWCHQVPDPPAEFLEHSSAQKLTRSGGTRGKTTCERAGGVISELERIVTIEDAADPSESGALRGLETRPPNVEGKGAVKQRQLLVNALRMRPDRIIAGETRGEEALDMLQAMNTGHDGSLTTVHANTPRDALSRIETMIAMGATNLPERAMRSRSRRRSNRRSTVPHERRHPQGDQHLGNHRQEGDVITMQEIFLFEKVGVDQNGKVVGRFRATVSGRRCVSGQDRRRAPGGDMFEATGEVR